MPGVILAVMKNVMRTDGVTCDALLGAGEALDDYSKGLQQEALDARRLENSRDQAELDKAKLALELVKSGNAEAAKIFHDVFPVPDTETLALVAAPAATTNGGVEG